MKKTHAIVAMAGMFALYTAYVAGQTANSPSEPDEPPFITLKGGNLAVRGVDEAEFGEKTKKVPVELFQDPEFDSLVYLTNSGAVAAMPAPKNYELVVLETADSFEAIRYSPASGAAWRIDGDEWRLLEEDDPKAVLPIGDYEVQAVLTTSDSMAVLRIDRRSGVCWYLSRDKWTLVEEGK